MSYQTTRERVQPVRASGLSLELVRQFPVSAQAPAEARRALESLRGAVGPDDLDDLRLLITELVTNSFRHGSADAGTPIDLRVSVGRATIRVEVRDSGWGFTPPAASDLLDEGGLGLFLIDQMADRWGVRQDPTTCVWFEMPTGESRAAGERHAAAPKMEKPWQTGNLGAGSDS